MTEMPHDNERRALWDKINLLRRERVQLRRELAAARRGVAATPPGERDDAPEPPAAPPSRSVLVPRFEAPAEAALRKLPTAIAAQAVSLTGQLGAGDASAWKQVKQAKDMRRPLFLARVGIHHRLLFRLDGAFLAVVDVVPRAHMEHTIDQQRRQGR